MVWTRHPNIPNNKPKLTLQPPKMDYLQKHPNQMATQRIQTNIQTNKQPKTTRTINTMSQEDIKQYLLNKRLSGDEGFFTLKQIRDSLKEGKNNVHKNINKLYFYGVIELETTIDRDLRYGTKSKWLRELIFPRRFRISKKYLNENKH